MADYILVDETTRDTSAQPPSIPESEHIDVRDHFTQTTSEVLRHALEAHPITSIYTVTFFILTVILFISLATIALFGVLLAALSVAVSGVLLILALGTRLAVILFLTMVLFTCGTATVAAFSLVGPSIFRTARRGLSQIPEMPSQADWENFSNAFTTYLANARQRRATLASTTSGLPTSTSRVEELFLTTVLWIRAFPWREWHTLITTTFRNITSRFHLSVPSVVPLATKVAFDLAAKSIHLGKLVTVFLWSFFLRRRAAERMPESAKPPRDADNLDPVDTSGMSTSVSLNLERSQPSTSVSRRDVDGS